MKNMFLIRGIAGSGKTTLANLLAGATGAVSVTADDYFIGDDGVYRFNPNLLPNAHAQCQEQSESALESGRTVVVHNTFLQRWEMEAYFSMAEKNGYCVTVTSVYDGGCTDEELVERNSHGVPLETIKRMRANYEMDWKNGNPAPPWER